MNARIEFIACALLFISFSTVAQLKPGGSSKGLAKVNAGLPYVLMNGNNVTSWVHSDGFFNWNERQSWNGEFPKGSGVGTIFSEGIVFGGYVTDGLYSNALRVNGDSYQIGMQPGAIQSDASGHTIGADDPTALASRAFGIRPDMPPSLRGDTLHWPNLNVDAATSLQKSVDSISISDRQQIANQYFQDWTEWPAKKGAPWFIDSIRIVRNDGGFDPQNPHHIPGIPDAAKTIWFVCNDQNAAVTQSFAGSPPMGVEEQMTLWEYRMSGTLDPLNNICYKQIKLIYKGNPGAPQNSRIDSMYIGQWSDPDVGFGGDDLIGCDSLLNLGFAYNSQTKDSLFALAGLQTPSTGFMYLQGTSHHTGNSIDSAVVNFEWRKGYKSWHTKPMTSFIPFTPFYGGLDDIVLYNDPRYWYWQLHGNLPNQTTSGNLIYPDGVPYYLSSQYAVSHNIVTPYACSGDPFTSSGWVDGIDNVAGDRRMLCNHGPFALSLGDTAEVVIALVDALGGDNRWSVQILKYNATFAKYLFNGSVNPSRVVGSVKVPQLPRSFAISQNYPNPFNPSTKIRYEVPTTSKVVIKIFNVLGQEIVTLVNEQKNAGNYTLEWNAAKVPSGVYFYQTEATSLGENGISFRDVKKMIVLK